MLVQYVFVNSLIYWIRQFNPKILKLFLSSDSMYSYYCSFGLLPSLKVILPPFTIVENGTKFSKRSLPLTDIDWI